MKLKLLIISILALLSLVAYQKYSEYSALKSINSYESCVTAKGSTIQESYPAICATRIGSHFAQTYYGVLPTIDNKGWKTFKSKLGYQFSFPGNWEVDDSLYGDDHTQNITLIHSRQGDNIYYLSTITSGRDGPWSEGVRDYQIMLDGKSATKRVWSYKNTPILISVIADFEVPFNHIEITVPPSNPQQYLNTVDKILSTFKFTY